MVKKGHSCIRPKSVPLNRAWFSRSRVLNKGRFRFPVWRNFGKFHVPNGTLYSNCTDPNQVTNLLVFCSFKQDRKERYWGQQFCQMERDIRSDQSGAPSKLVLSIPVGSNRNGLFHLMYQPKFPDFLCWMESAHIFKFILGSEASGNKTKEMYYSLLSLKMISFVLFFLASQRGMKFHILYTVCSPSITQCKTIA